MTAQRCSGAAKCDNKSDLQRYVSEPEHLLGNDGRVGRCILECVLLCRRLRAFLIEPLLHFCLSRYSSAAAQRRSEV